MRANLSGALAALVFFSSVVGCFLKPKGGPPADGDSADPPSRTTESAPTSVPTTTPPPSAPPDDVDAGAGAQSDAGKDDFDTLSKCTNGYSFWLVGAEMSPGQACNGCHRDFVAAGTLYPTAREPNGCKGVNAGAKIVATDANAQEHEITVNASGNFYTRTAIATPYRVKVVETSGAVRAMATPITGAMGDCNSCHAQTGGGTPAARGRIIGPH